jgi:hypothetical protein
MNPLPNFSFLVYYYIIPEVKNEKPVFQMDYQLYSALV